MTRSQHLRRITADDFQATQPGRFTDMPIPRGSVLSFLSDPALSPQHVSFPFEWAGREFVAPITTIRDKSAVVISSVERM
jgi:hypothetical protein